MSHTSQALKALLLAQLSILLRFLRRLHLNCRFDYIQVLNEISGLYILSPEKCRELAHTTVNYDSQHDLCVAKKHAIDAAEKRYQVGSVPLSILFISLHCLLSKMYILGQNPFLQSYLIVR